MPAAPSIDLPFIPYVSRASVPPQSAGTLLVEEAAVRKENERLRAENDRLRNEVARIRSGEEPAGLSEQITTPGQFLWVLGHSRPEIRLQLAKSSMQAMQEAFACMEGNHTGALAMWKQRAENQADVIHQAQTEAQAMAAGTEDPAARGIALTFAAILNRSSFRPTR
ncbi:hypothetical protein KUF83_30280 [Streptomyces sp. BV286]|uniref:hypothetical protein n=1 Tax=Streptomyces sp. BV286 TaxID=2849672 RepID=UPI001C2E2954|nr:hypothetical protein [Streptomyces sp. BV286]MBV1940824.1 hypothetical protein [Streptomyces sp. BV286]